MDCYLNMGRNIAANIRDKSMKWGIVLLASITLAGCTSAPERPGYAKEVIAAEGKIVYVYVTGYSIEEFLCEFSGNSQCRNMD